MKNKVPTTRKSLFQNYANKESTNKGYETKLKNTLTISLSPWRVDLNKSGLNAAKKNYLSL